MPELPEIETIVRSLKPRIVGRTVGAIRLLWPPLLRTGTTARLTGMADKRILGLSRRGKLVMIDLEGESRLVFHLKMTGQLFIANEDEPVDKHLRLVIGLNEGHDELRFRDIRKFGFMLCLGPGEGDSCPELVSLGPEPLQVTADGFSRRFSGRKAVIKALLLNQEVVAGLGNIYVDESLFDARIHPLTPARQLSRDDLNRLRRSVRKILRRAIAAGGSSIRDYVDGEGRKGNFQVRHKVYGREGKPCLACGTKIERIRVAGRSSFFCPNCQKAPGKSGRSN